MDVVPGVVWLRLVTDVRQMFPPPPARPRWKSVAIVVAVVAALGAASVLTWQALDAQERSKREFLVVGDSVTYLSAGSIEAELGRGHVQFIAKPGYPTKNLRDLTRQAIEKDEGPAGRGDVVAVLVGYNDVSLGTVDTDALPDLVRRTSEFRCAVWLTLPARPGGEPSTNPTMDSAAIDLWNERLATETAGFDSVHLADDWNDAVTQSPAGTLLEPDGVHPNLAGQRRLAVAYAAAIDRFC